MYFVKKAHRYDQIEFCQKAGSNALSNKITVFSLKFLGRSPIEKFVWEEIKMLKFAIIGAGAGGQSMAAILTSKGYTAKLYDIDQEKIRRLRELKIIKVTGVIECEAAPAVITDRIEEALDDVDVVMIVKHRLCLQALPEGRTDRDAESRPLRRCSGDRQHPAGRERLRQGSHHCGGG